MIVPFVADVLRVYVVGLIVPAEAITPPDSLYESLDVHTLSALPSELRITRYSSLVPFVGVFDGTVNVNVCVLSIPCITGLVIATNSAEFGTFKYIVRYWDFVASYLTVAVYVCPTVILEGAEIEFTVFFVEGGLVVSPPPVKFAVAVVVAFIVTLHTGFNPVHVPPLQPENA